MEEAVSSSETSVLTRAKGRNNTTVQHNKYTSHIHNTHIAYKQIHTSHKTTPQQTTLLPSVSRLSKKMWDPQHLTTLLACTACYGDSFTFSYVDDVRTSQETQTSTTCYVDSFAYLYVNDVRTSQETRVSTVMLQLSFHCKTCCTDVMET
jgi:hypothetical protein